jgi:hypothetical protein
MNHPDVTMMVLRAERELERRDFLAQSRSRWERPAERAPSPRSQPGRLLGGWQEVAGALRCRRRWILLQPRSEAPPVAA